MATKARMEWLDSLRGLALLFVMFGHYADASECGAFFRITSPIKIPLLFAISGYLFNADKYPRALDFLKNKLTRLLIPYLTLAAVIAIPQIALAAGGGLKHAVVREIFEILTGKALWYIPCLIICDIALYIITKLARGKLLHISLACAALAAAGFFIVREGRVTYWHADAALIMIGCMAAGMALRRISFKPRPTAALASAAIYAALILLDGGYIDVNRSVYPCAPLNAAQMLAGIAALFMCAQCVPVRLAPLSYIGRNSLAYYAFHQLAGSALKFGFGQLGLDYPAGGTPVAALIRLIIACAALAVVSEAINALAPFAVGKRRSEIAPLFRRAKR